MMTAIWAKVAMEKSVQLVYEHSYTPKKRAAALTGMCRKPTDHGMRRAGTGYGKTIARY